MAAHWFIQGAEYISINGRLFIFEGKKIPLNPGFGTFIAMNPGHSGRFELPDNLKAMFRPVVMVCPNNELIF